MNSQRNKVVRKSTAEQQRLETITDDVHGWRRWGPYVSDRSWGTVREDYSSNGNAWTFLSHDQARSKAYRWGEDGIAGICDRYQSLVFAPAFWNEQDSILKERFFGLTPQEGNHGEDVKEYYFHADCTPTHSYMKLLYKYSQHEYPYSQLIHENNARHGQGPEYELIDTGIFNEQRYFDIEIEYAKADAEDIYIRITATNRGPAAAPLHILPQLWFRNTWSWSGTEQPRPQIAVLQQTPEFIALLADDLARGPLMGLPFEYQLGERVLYADQPKQILFTDNETNAPLIFGAGQRSQSHYVKDAFHRYLVQGEEDAIRPAEWGTKSALHYLFPAIQPGEKVTVQLRLTNQLDLTTPFAEFNQVFAQRITEADEFYQAIAPPQSSPDEQLVQRQAFAGVLWTKQIYLFDVEKWLSGDNPQQPPAESRHYQRNQHWRHLNSMRIISMPDKWEYPWFAAWDLAFHCVTLAQIDPQFAKDQLWMLLFEQFQHPNGQLPAYEWDFSDLNPPVHAWAVWRVYNMDYHRTGTYDYEFLESCFHKLIINFAWWINKVDREGHNVFEGGFLGLDNIAVVDRSERCRDGSVLEQSDATGWMGMYCLNLMRIALELAKQNPVYENMAIKYFQHYTYVAAAMFRRGNRDYQLWDEDDGFFYDVLRHPNGKFSKFRVRSLVGLIPLFAVERLEESWMQPFENFTKCFHWFLENRAVAVKSVVHKIEQDGKVTYALTIVNQDQLARILTRVWDANEFLSPYGMRSLSKFHEQHPFEFQASTVNYEPAEAISKIKGGNSNWRGPIWFPTNFLMIEALRKLGKAFGPEWKLEVPDGRKLGLTELAGDLANRLIQIFTRNAKGIRPVYAGAALFQHDPQWRDLLQFYEYFHGDDGAGLGASHQTGWTALVATIIEEWRTTPQS